MNSALAHECLPIHWLIESCLTQPALSLTIAVGGPVQMGLTDSLTRYGKQIATATVIRSMETHFGYIAINGPGS